MHLRFLKEWTLPIAILTGAAAYFLQAALPFLDKVRPYAAETVGIVQPVLIFSMLFLTFCKIDGKSLRPRRVHALMLTIQAVLYSAIALLLHFFPALPLRTAWEGLMICLLCPTATAAAVVTSRLGGDSADVTSYTILINLLAALLLPLTVPLVMTEDHLSFFPTFGLILSKVFPLLVFPLLSAIAVKAFLPRLHVWFCARRDLGFYLWAVALSIAIAVTVRSIVHSSASLTELTAIGGASLLACVFQFFAGRQLGQRFGHTVSTSQALGQKNTVFAIWVGSTLFDPLSSLAGGFYCIWHNLYNTYQLRRKERPYGLS